jgi:FtsH-binding integral membrane protein
MPSLYFQKKHVMNPESFRIRPVRPADVAEATAVDLGLRRYMLSVYNYMAAGLGVTGSVAYVAVATGFYQQIAGTPLIWVVMLAPLAAVLFLSFRIDRMSLGAAQVAVSMNFGPLVLTNSGPPSGVQSAEPSRGRAHQVSVGSLSFPS